MCTFVVVHFLHDEYYLARYCYYTTIIYYGKKWSGQLVTILMIYAYVTQAKDCPIFRTIFTF